MTKTEDSEKTEEPHENKDKKEKKHLKEEQYVPFSVILGRDLIFMDWTVQFGSQMLGLLVGGILGFIFGIKVFALFTGSATATAYLIFQIGIILSAIALCVYYISKLGIKINSPKKIANNKLNIIKIAFFGLSFIFGISYLYNAQIAPAVHKAAGIVQPPGGSNGGDGGTSNGGSIDFNTTNEYVMLLLTIVLATAIFALLYAGIMYSINTKVNTLPGVAIGASSILLTFFLLSQYSFSEYLFKAFQTKSYSLILIFLSDLLYYSIVSLVTILTYHLSRRIEISIIILFFGFIFGYGAPSNVVMQIIALKWGFPNFSDGIVTTADILTKSLESLEYAGLAGMIIFPLIFYKDAYSFFVQLWRTIKEEGVSLMIFSFVVLVIEIIVVFISQYLGILLFLIVFIVLVGIVNSFISSRYGKQSYTALLAKMSQATIQMSEAIIPTQEKQINFLEKRIKKRDIVYLIVGTALPVFIYFLTMYITTAITAQTPIGSAIFLFTVVPASIGLIFFAISFYFLKNPIIKSIYNYPLQAISLVGAFI